MKQSASLDSWREFFRREDSDIFEIIENAIMVAAKDCPNKFKSKRDKIAELLFSCRVSRCIGCDHHDGDDGGRRREIDDGVDEDNGTKESKANSSYDDDIEEVVRIKEILSNKEHETNLVLLESLRELKLMSLNVEILKSTEIGKAVNGLRKHGCDKIRQLAKTLISEWKELVDQWVNTTKEITGAEGTPESANPSVVDEEEEFPSLPYDVDIFTPEPNGFEISHFFDSLDVDGNPRDSEEYKTSREQGRRPQNIAKRRPEMRKPMSANEVNMTRRPLKYSTERQMKNETVHVEKPERPVIQRKPLGTEHKRKAPEHQQELKGLDADAKFEFSKRKLQESYQQHENAKKQRTIQVLDTIPKQGNGQKPQLKRPGMSNRNWSNGRK